MGWHSQPHSRRQSQPHPCSQQLQRLSSQSRLMLTAAAWGPSTTARSSAAVAICSVPCPTPRNSTPAAPHHPFLACSDALARRPSKLPVHRSVPQHHCHQLHNPAGGLRSTILRQADWRPARRTRRAIAATLGWERNSTVLPRSTLAWCYQGGHSRELSPQAQVRLARARMVGSQNGVVSRHADNYCQCMGHHGLSHCTCVT